MKNNFTSRYIFTCVACFYFLSAFNSAQAQCANADFSDGSFTGWTGTYSNHVCTGTYLLGICTGCSATNPLDTVGFNQGPNNNPPDDAAHNYSHVITTTAGGNDPNLTSLGATLPMVWPGGGSQYACRQGNMWQTVGADALGDGESTSYSFLVTPANCNFIYHYAVALNDGGHSEGEQPYFNISMTDSGGHAIAAGLYEVDATTAQTIGGFNYISSASVLWKPWTTDTVLLNNYIGQTVKVTFKTRGCLPSGCSGSHYAYAYISADCAPVNGITVSSTIGCGSSTASLSAPAGATSYAWSGPGIIGANNTQAITANQPGQYSVTLIHAGTIPDTLTFDTVISTNYNSLIANFSTPPACTGKVITFADASISSGTISGWAWDFNNDGTSDASVQNPTHIFLTAGTYPVKLTVTSTPCTKDTIINITVFPSPTSTFTALSPLCFGQHSTITYTGIATVNATYTWDFSGGTVISGSNAGPYTVNWATPGTFTLTLSVTDNGCASPFIMVPVTVNPIPTATFTAVSPVCVSQNSTLTYTGSASVNATYTWNFASGNATPASGQGPFQVNWATSGVENVTLTVTENGCVSAPITVPVTVNATPTATFTATGPVCTGDASTVTYTGTGDNLAIYTWSFAGGNATPGSGRGPFQVNWATPGVENITLTVTENGCVSAPVTLPVTVNAIPIATFTTNLPVCMGENSTVTYTGNADTSATYTWNFDSGTITSGSGQGPYQVIFESSGPIVTLMVTENGCTSSIFRDTLEAAICEGIENLDSSNLSIYPNPTKNDFTVQVSAAIENGQIEIYNMLGQRLYIEEIKSAPAGFSKQIHFAAATGIYSLILNDGQRIYTRKVIVE